MKITAAVSFVAIFLTTSVFAAKPHPFGIIRLFSTSYGQPEAVPGWDNPNIDGMRLRPAWQDLQASSESSVNWARIDAILLLAGQYNKTIGLSVGAGVNTPEWVYSAGATKFALHDGSGFSMPLPWDSVFLAKWKGFIKAMGDRYDSNPRLGYIVISGLGQNVETYLSKCTTDDEMINSMGGTSAWVGAAKEIIAAYADAFPLTPFFITAAKPLASQGGAAALQEVVDWGVATYPGRFGIMNASLNAKSSTNYYPHEAINTFHTTQPVGLQMLCSASLDPVRLSGTLDEALTHGVLLGAKFIEVYQSDADLESSQPILQRQGDALEANARPQPPQNLQLAED